MLLRCFCCPNHRITQFSFGSCREIQLTHAQHDYHLEILIVYLDIAGVERGDDNRTLKVEIRIERTLKCLCLVWYGPGGRRDLSTLVTLRPG